MRMGAFGGFWRTLQNGWARTRRNCSTSSEIAIWTEECISFECFMLSFDNEELFFESGRKCYSREETLVERSDIREFLNRASSQISELSPSL